MQQTMSNLVSNRVRAVSRDKSSPLRQSSSSQAQEALDKVVYGGKKNNSPLRNIPPASPQTVMDESNLLDESIPLVMGMDNNSVEREKKTSLAELKKKLEEEKKAQEPAL